MTAVVVLAGIVVANELMHPGYVSLFSTRGVISVAECLTVLIEQLRPVAQSW